MRGSTWPPRAPTDAFLHPLSPCSSLPEEKSKTSSSFETGPKASEKPDAEQAELDPEQKRSRARERRREGRSKTFDWAEFRPIQQALAQERANAADSSKSGSAAFPKDPGATDADPGELERERARRREERRKRFEMIDAVDGAGSEEVLRMEVDRILPVPADIKPQNVHVEIEQRWHQVETTPLREEKQIPIAPLHLAHAEDQDEGLAKQHLTTLLEKEVKRGVWGAGCLPKWPPGPCRKPEPGLENLHLFLLHNSNEWGCCRVPWGAGRHRSVSVPIKLCQQLSCSHSCRKGCSCKGRTSLPPDFITASAANASVGC